MRKRIGIMLILLTLLLQSSLVSATTNRMRVLGGGGLDGIIADEVTDIRLNSAQLLKIKKNKLFLDSRIKLEDNSDQLLLSPRVAYHLKEDNVLELYADLNSRELGNDVLSFRVADAVKYNQQLIIGGRLGVTDLDSETKGVIAGGFVYQEEPGRIIDGSLGINYGGQLIGSSDQDVTSLFLRTTKKINQDESIVALMNFNFSDYDPQTKIDISYLPYVQIGDNATTDINLFFVELKFKDNP